MKLDHQDPDLEDDWEDLWEDPEQEKTPLELWNEIKLQKIRDDAVGYHDHPIHNLTLKPRPSEAPWSDRWTDTYHYGSKSRPQMKEGVLDYRKPPYLVYEEENESEVRPKTMTEQYWAPKKEERQRIEYSHGTLAPYLRDKLLELPYMEKDEDEDAAEDRNYYNVEDPLRGQEWTMFIGASIVLGMTVRAWKAWAYPARLNFERFNFKRLRFMPPEMKFPTSYNSLKFGRHFELRYMPREIKNENAKLRDSLRKWTHWPVYERIFQYGMYAGVVPMTYLTVEWLLDDWYGMRINPGEDPKQFAITASIVAFLFVFTQKGPKAVPLSGYLQRYAITLGGIGVLALGLRHHNMIYGRKPFMPTLQHFHMEEEDDSYSVDAPEGVGNPKETT